MAVLKFLDGALGRLYLRAIAVLAFLAAAGAFTFGLVVAIAGHIQAGLAFALGVIFLWLGRRAWRSQVGLARVLADEGLGPSTRAPNGTLSKPPDTPR